MNLLLLTLILTFAGASGSGIVGGHESDPHSRPYMVSLQAQGLHVCGGILIREDFVLTSAHCKNGTTVVLGAHNLTKTEDTQKISVATYHPHPSYNQKDVDCMYDIMLLKLKKNATVNKNVEVIKLPPKDVQILANMVCNVTGWGKTGPSESASDVLREVKVKTEFNFVCANKWKETFNSQQMICTRSKKAGFCQGDSGGPLIYNGMPLGIVAYHNDKRCDEPKTPRVYMNIAYFDCWIYDILFSN